MSFVTDVIVGNDESECARLGSAAIDGGGVEGDELKPGRCVEGMLSTGTDRYRWKEEGEDVAEEQADEGCISSAAEQWVPSPRRAGPYKCMNRRHSNIVTPGMITTSRDWLA